MALNDILRADKRVLVYYYYIVDIMDERKDGALPKHRAAPNRTSIVYFHNTASAPRRRTVERLMRNAASADD